MKKIGLLITCALCLIAQAFGSDVNRSQIFTATGADTVAVNLVNKAVYYHRLTWTGSGTRTSCLVKVQQSVTGTGGWSDLIAAQDCTTNGSATATGYANYIRINVTALTGASNTVYARYDGSAFSVSSQRLDPEANPTFAGETLTGFSGVLKATAGVVGGSATLDDIADGTTYKRGWTRNSSTGVLSPSTAGDSILISRNASYLNLNGGRQLLRDFDAQLAKMSQGAAQATIAFIGDSWTSQQSVTGSVASYLQGLYGFAGAGYISFNSASPIPAGLTRVRNGTWVDGTNTYGASLYYVTSTDIATPATKTLTGRATQLIIHYLRQPGGGSFTWAIDGGSETTINTSNASTVMGFVTISDLSATDIHTLVIKVTVAGTGVNIAGADFQANSATGIRVANLGHTGTTAGDWIDVIDATLWENSLSAIAPNLVVIMLGVNDEATGVTPASYYASMDSLVKRVWAAMPAASVLLISPSAIADIYAYPMISYVDQLAILAASDKTAFINNYTLLGDYATADARGLYANTTQLNASGANLIANHLNSFILQAYTPRAQSLLSWSGLNGIAGQVSIGSTNLPALTTGYAETGIGYLTLNAVTTGIGSTALGYNALPVSTTSSYNVAVGYNALSLTTTGGSNIAVGKDALKANTTHIYNVAVGTGALTASDSNYGTAVGTSSLGVVTSGAGNTAIGYNSGATLTTGSNNTLIGNAANANANNLANATALGYQAVVTASNQMMFGNASVTANIFHGTIQSQAAVPWDWGALSTSTVCTLDTTAYATVVINTVTRKIALCQ